MKELLEDCIKKTEPEYYPPVEKNTVAGKTAKVKEKELEEWLRGLEGMNRLVDDYVGDKDSPLGEDYGPAGNSVLCMGEDCF